MTAPAPAVQLNRVTLRYGLRPVLRDVSLEIHPGTVVGLIGPGGAGKTQLLKVMATLRTPWEGSVTLFNRRVDAWRRRGIVDVRSSIGLQFQNFALFDFLDVWHNVAFCLVNGPPRPEAEVNAQVKAALDAVGLSESAEKFPGELSGGMRRRVAIARVMASRPQLALFDDPVAGLDPVNSARIMALIGTFARRSRAATVVATHDVPRLAGIADRLVAVFDGRVLYDGRTAGIVHAAEPRVREFYAAAREDAA